jgi:drug/metabolite transporter (DMT)-like permease
MAGTSKTVFAYSGLFVLSLIWGLAFVAIRRADMELSFVNLALLRWFIAAALLLVLLPIIGRPKVELEKGDVPRLLLVAFANVAGYHLSLNYAETAISAGLSGLLVSLGPIFMVVLSFALLDERVGRRILLGLILAVFGAVILSIGSINLGDFASFVGPGAVVLSAFCYASFTVLSKPLVHKYGSAPTTILAGLFGTAMLLPLASGSLISQTMSLSMDGWISVLYLSVLSTVFGYLLFYSLVSRGAVSRLSIQLYLVPVVSVIGGAVLLGEPVTLATLVGGGTMLSAIALATWK